MILKVLLQCQKVRDSVKNGVLFLLNECFEERGYVLNIEVIRSSRKTMVLEVTREGRVIVRAPYRMPQAKIERFVREKADWIEKSLAKAARREAELEETPKLTREDMERLANEALRVIPSKVEYYAGLVGVTYGRITIRNQKSRWGSCSAKGNLNFNCLLMLTPESVQDYVVVHELCHRKEMNHSARFWQEVEKVLPDYRQRRRWLKEHGTAIIGSMPR